MRLICMIIKFQNTVVRLSWSLAVYKLNALQLSKKSAKASEILSTNISEKIYR